MLFVKSNPSVKNYTVFCGNTSTTVTDDTTSFSYIAGGTLLPTGSPAADFKKRIRLPFEMRDGDVYSLFVVPPNDTYHPAGEQLPQMTSGTNTYGMWWTKVSGSATDIDVWFGHDGATPDTTWATLNTAGWKWVFRATTLWGGSDVYPTRNGVTVTQAEAQNYVAGDMVWCSETSTLYQYDAGSSATRDGTFVLSVLSGTGRLLAIAGQYARSEIIRGFAGNGIKFQENGGVQVGSVSDAGAWEVGPASYAGTHTVNGKIKVLQGNADSFGLEMRGTTAESTCRIKGGGASGDSNFMELDFFGSATQSTRSISIQDTDSTLAVFRGNGSVLFNAGSLTGGFELATTGAVTLGPSNLTSAHTINGAVQVIAESGTTEWVYFQRLFNNSDSSRNGLLLQRSKGTSASPTGVVNQTYLGTVCFGGRDSAGNYSQGYNGGVEIIARATETWSASARGSSLSFHTTPTGTAAVIQSGSLSGGGAWVLGPSSGLNTFHLIQASGASEFACEIKNTDQNASSKGLRVLAGNTSSGLSVPSLYVATWNDGVELLKVTGANGLYAKLANASTANAMYFNTSTQQITYASSSARFKDNIRNSIYGLAAVMALQSRMFEYKSDGRTDIGLIAEEVFEIIPELTGRGPDGLIEAVDYAKFGSVCVAAIQEQQAIIEGLKSRIEVLEAAS
jgi:hypothetical protein